MNKLLPSFLAACGLACTLAAQEAKPAAPPAPAPTKPAPEPRPGDPFVRDPHAAKAPPPPAAPAPVGLPRNLLVTVETWSLSQADFVALLDGPADGRAPYDRLEELAKAGKAKLTGLIGVNTKSGQRAVAEMVDEVRYPNEFSAAPRAGEIAFPTAYEIRNVGDTLEVEPVLGPDDKTIDVNLVPHSSRFDGFRDWQPEATAAPVGRVQFRSERVSCSTSVISGRPAFLDTATPAGQEEAQGVRQVSIRTLRVAVQPVQPGVLPGAEAGYLGRAEFLLYSVDREAARHILNDTADSAQSYAAVRALVAKGEAQLETVSAFVVKSGQRAVNEEVAGFSYPYSSNGPSFATSTTPPEGRQPASFLEFSVRDTGVTVEIEPMFSPDARFVDINLVPQVIRMTGLLKATGVAAKYPPQPVFTVRKVTTSVSAGAGVPALLGTMSLPRDNGVNDRKDDGRTGLAYLRVTVFRP